MKIRMLSTQNGSLDGIRVKEYAAGTEHNMTETPGARDLAQAFVSARMAVEIAPAAPDPEPTKAIAAAPENKMLEPPLPKVQAGALRPEKRKSK